MNKIKVYIAALSVSIFGAIALIPAGNAAAFDPLAEPCANGGASEICNQQSEEDAGQLIADIVNILLFIVGTLSVIMIIVSGLMYVSSTGDSGRVTKAKNTLMYSIVGLIVAFVAFAIVNWVVDKL